MGAVTIVGMRHHSLGGKIRSWAKGYTDSNNAKKCLYLVPEPNNAHDKNAIALHDGKVRVGYVQASEAPHIAEMLRGSEDVYCVYVSQIGHPGYEYSEPSFLRVTAFCRVDERLARKYTCEPSSKTTPSTHKKRVAVATHKKEVTAWVPKSKYETDLGFDQYMGQYGFDETY